MKEGTPRNVSFIELMNALPVQKLPEGDWLYEVKFDGYRALAFKDDKDVRLVSRNNKPLNYPQVLDSLKLFAVEQAPTRHSTFASTRASLSESFDNFDPSGARL
jgi:ATP-dependent DNA ligase